MHTDSEADWLVVRHYQAIERDHPEWPDEKKLWVARRRAFRTRKILGLPSVLPA